MDIPRMILVFRSLIGATNRGYQSQPQFQLSKLSDLRAYLFTYEPEIVVLNETWLNKHVNDGELVSDQFYTVYRKDSSAMIGKHMSVNLNRVRFFLLPKGSFIMT
eukprot:sb/3477979/